MSEGTSIAPSLGDITKDARRGQLLPYNRQMPPRAYLDSHDFLTFNLPRDLGHVPLFWLRMGEARSKCQHIAGAPLPPAVALELGQIYMAKGIHATTAIEGNTLTEHEVREVLAGTADIPPSRDYLEVDLQSGPIPGHRLPDGEAHRVGRRDRGVGRCQAAGAAGGGEGSRLTVSAAPFGSIAV